MTDHCDVQIFFWVWTKLLPLHGGAVMWRSVMCLWFDFLSSSDVASCEVICGTAPVLLCTTKTYNVLLQYYSNVLLRTTTYYSRTTLYYKVLLQYYSVLRSTTPYCKVLRQYYSALHSTTPVLLCTTKYYSSSTPVLQSTTLYYKVLRQYYKVLRQYYYVLLQYYSVLQSTTPVLLCTTSDGSRIIWKFDDSRIEWVGSMEDQNWIRDERNKRIYTYAQAQRK